MYYVSTVNENSNLYGITDTLDNVEEFYNYYELMCFKAKGVDIYGISEEDGKYYVKEFLKPEWRGKRLVDLNSATLTQLRLMNLVSYKMGDKHDLIELKLNEEATVPNTIYVIDFDKIDDGKLKKANINKVLNYSDSPLIIIISANLAFNIDFFKKFVKIRKDIHIHFRTIDGYRSSLQDLFRRSYNMKPRLDISFDYLPRGYNALMDDVNIMLRSAVFYVFGFHLLNQRYDSNEQLLEDYNKFLKGNEDYILSSTCYNRLMNEPLELCYSLYSLNEWVVFDLFNVWLGITRYWNNHNDLYLFQLKYDKGIIMRGAFGSAFLYVLNYCYLSYIGADCKDLYKVAYISYMRLSEVFSSYNYKFIEGYNRALWTNINMFEKIRSLGIRDDDRFRMPIDVVAGVLYSRKHNEWSIYYTLELCYREMYRGIDSATSKPKFVPYSSVPKLVCDEDTVYIRSIRRITSRPKFKQEIRRCFDMFKTKVGKNIDMTIYEFFAEVYDGYCRTIRKKYGFKAKLVFNNETDSLTLKFS